MNWPTFNHEAMATTFQIAVAGMPTEYARQATTAAFRELDRLTAELSRYVESSDIASINRLGRDESTPIGEDTLQCLLIAVQISAATNRAFDPAYASTRNKGTAPDAPLFAIDSSSHQLTSLTTQLHLDLGAVGKGYALDRMADTLREWDIESACLHSGGSTVLALAAPQELEGWPVGLEAKTLFLSHRALSGSGIAVKGRHLIDPRSGQPASRMNLAWALAETAAESDALSTAFFVMTDSEVAAFCATHPAFGAVISDVAGSLVSYGAAPAVISAPTKPAG